MKSRINWKTSHFVSAFLGRPPLMAGEEKTLSEEEVANVNEALEKMSEIVKTLEPIFSNAKHRFSSK